MTTEILLADFLTQDEAAAELKVCRRTLDRWRQLGEGPPVTKVGRRILYRRTSLQRWLAAQEQIVSFSSATPLNKGGRSARPGQSARF
jgi:excisionase family DNA binding protein